MVSLHVSTIQRYSTKDGPGICSTVFLIGCNLRCVWCSNPELMLPGDKLLHFSSLCRKCQSCVRAYPDTVYMQDGELHMHKTAQLHSCELEEICPYDALEHTGMQVDPVTLVEQLLKDRIFYEESAGGVTFSGGEPLLQAEALYDALYLLKQKGISVCVDTAGDVEWKVMEKVASQCDLFLYDIKAYDNSVHQRITGVGNARILDNARKLAAMHKPLWIRMVIVKGQNDDYRDLLDRLTFISSLGAAVKRVDLLPYHSLGVGKYKSLGLPYPITGDATPDAETLAYCMEVGRKLGLSMYMEG